MKIGDLVLYGSSQVPSSHKAFHEIGIVVRIDDSHRQTVADVLFSDGLARGLWDRHLEVLDERGVI